MTPESRSVARRELERFTPRFFARWSSYMPDVYSTDAASFPPDLAECTGFEWDAGNSEKTGVSHEEAVQIDET